MKVHQSQAEPNLQRFDVILLNSSAGKDSMATLDFIATVAARQGILDRVVVGHADLGRVEWPGARTLAEHQADRYDLRFEVVAPRGLDLLQRVERRGMWPSCKTRPGCSASARRGELQAACG
jgi:3'-phosphoadenosine 5'-phosphosulfate sulfotransferase (PAPS reductase)/FAD synthetase